MSKTTMILAIFLLVALAALLVLYAAGLDFTNPAN